MTDRTREEILESLWVLREEGRDTYDELLRYSNLEDPHEKIEALLGEGLLSREGDRLLFTAGGEREGANITRRHRLAERLLADVLHVEDDKLLESTACDWEHVLNPGVMESICTLLGHPPFCPHDRPIPPGDCCRRSERTVQPLTVRLADAEVGRSTSIVFIAPVSRQRLERLLALGISPGCLVKLVQKRPAYVIAVGETMLAVDREIAEEIYVRPTGPAV